MMSSLANAILFFALVITSFCVLVMHRKFKRFEASHAEYKRAFEQSVAALGSAGDAVRTFAADGRGTLDELAIRIDEARTLVSQLDSGMKSFRVDTDHDRSLRR
ncbi:hypothetical protein AB4072_16865 [Microvirga sp. 2MCAF38]|uniref:hypothetical protein n=1 Tax=Microvirga sp. 2MCAF38 TaxID=3232989 RepID=UPI003F97CF09